MRSTNSIDIGKLASMIRSPGIDTRVWLTFAVVKAVRIVTAAQATSKLNAGIYADLTFLPYQEEYTGMVSTGYASRDAGFYAPLAVDDTVLVAVPYGDSASGVSVIARFHDSSDTPPEEFAENNGEDLVLVAEEEVNIRLITKGAGETQIEAKGDGSVRVTTKGSGNIVLATEASGKVGVGAEPGSAGMQPIALGQAIFDLLTQMKVDFDSHIHTVTIAAFGVPTPSLPPATSVPPTLFPSGEVRATKGEVK